jgi:8-oxo-dGTP diphosphatase
VADLSDQADEPDETSTERVIAAAGGVVWRHGEGDGVEVVLVHRPRYDDWSLPKGKLDAGEDHASAARREVEEETGLRCTLDEPLPTSRYRDRRGRPKVVRYWLMHPVAEAGAPSAYATGEIDQAVWRAVDDAVVLATYGRDRELIHTAAALVRART